MCLSHYNFDVNCYTQVWRIATNLLDTCSWWNMPYHTVTMLGVHFPEVRGKEWIPFAHISHTRWKRSEIWILLLVKIFPLPGSSRTSDIVRVLKMLQVPGTLVQYKINDDSAFPTMTIFFFSFQISPTVKSCLCSNGRANVVPSNFLFLFAGDSFGSILNLLLATACSQKLSTSPLLINMKQETKIITLVEILIRKFGILVRILKNV